MRRTAVLLVLLLAAPLAAGAGPPPKSLTTVTGQTVTLVGGRPGVTLLIFAARWCGPCERAIADVRESLTAHGRDGLRAVLVGVKARQSQAEFEAWARSAGFNGPVVFDAKGELEKGLDASLLPWFVFVGSDGKVLYAGDTPPPGAEIESWLASRSDR